VSKTCLLQLFTRGFTSLSTILDYRWTVE